MFKWVFFDLGGTLLDDVPFHDYIYKVMIDLFAENGYKVGWDNFIRARDAFVIKRVPVLRSLVVHFTGSETLKDPIMNELMKRIDGKGHELQTPRPESEAVLDTLGGHYKLGIIANQQVGIHILLKELGWQKRFDVTMISDDVGVWKPDVRIFQVALESAQCPPSQAVMVGDRVDNDIAPAKSLGMRTVRLRWGVFGSQKPSSDSETPDMQITSLSELPGALARLQ